MPCGIDSSPERGSFCPVVGEFLVVFDTSATRLTACALSGTA